MGNPVVYFEIMGADAAALRSFYGDVFGWHAGESMPGARVADYSLVQTGTGSGIEGGIGAAPSGYDGHATFYVAVEDVGRALETIEGRGGTRMIGPEQVPGGPVIGLFEDPQGHVVGLLQAPPR